MIMEKGHIVSMSKIHQNGKSRFFKFGNSLWSDLTQENSELMQTKKLQQRKIILCEVVSFLAKIMEVANIRQVRVHAN
ncbi:unnamed protein product [Coffea canephora]|uniref:Uncharacterized protein n=1 Tax=Coffea canephora TaxID=49390 RepID=A0A068VAX8_COFCA|nr:unnamed protein product [Coffea canephora]